MAVFQMESAFEIIQRGVEYEFYCQCIFDHFTDNCVLFHLSIVQMNSILFVFDIDGTITDTVLDHQKAFAQSLKEIGVENIRDDFNQFLHHTDSFISKTIYEKETHLAFNAEKQNAFEARLTEKILQLSIHEIPGASQLLKRLRLQNKVTIVFATGALRTTAEYKLKALKIPFEPWQLVASDSIQERENIVKQAISNALKLSSFEQFERIIAVGDGLWDLKAAQHLGLEFIGIGKKHQQTLLNHGADQLYADWTDFPIDSVFS